MNRMKFTLVIGILIVINGVIALSLAAKESSAETIIVAQDGSGDYEKIQEAIDNATEGDTIRVWEGTYEENVVVDKTLSLIGNGSEESTIDNSGSGDVAVKITADWVNMSGFMVIGSRFNKGGILIKSNNNTLTNNTCSNNTGSGIWVNESDNNILTNNTCSSNMRHGINVNTSDHNTFINNTLISNIQDGIQMEWSTYNNLYNNY